MEQNPTRLQRRFAVLKKFYLHLRHTTLKLENVEVRRTWNGVRLIGNPTNLRLERLSSLGICAFDESGFIGIVDRLPHFMRNMLNNPKRIHGITTKHYSSYRDLCDYHVRTYPSTNMVKVILLRKPMEISEWISFDDFELPKDLSDRGRIREPYLTKLVLWLRKYLWKFVTYPGMTVGRVVSMGIKEVILNTEVGSTPIEDEKCPMS